MLQRKLWRQEADEIVALLFPRTTRERWVFVVVALLLGFAVAHGYQGTWATLRTGVLGALLAIPVILIVTLLPSMIAHTGTDILGGVHGYRLLRRWQLLKEEGLQVKSGHLEIGVRILHGPHIILAQRQCFLARVGKMRDFSTLTLLSIYFIASCCTSPAGRQLSTTRFITPPGGTPDEPLYVNFAKDPLIVVLLFTVNACPIVAVEYVLRAGFAPGMTVGFVVYFVVYEEIHWRIHLGGWLPSWLESARRHHLKHHAVAEERFSVFLRVFDWLFGRSRTVGKINR
jgi:hypothetical protein